MDVSAAGWQPEGEVTLAQWRVYGRKLGAIARRVPFWLGDLLLYGETQGAWETDAEMASELTGLDPGQLIDMAHVAASFDDVRRRRRLSFEHHAAVCDLSVDDADELLEQAERGRWSVRRLERAVRELAHA